MMKTLISAIASMMLASSVAFAGDMNKEQMTSEIESSIGASAPGFEQLDSDHNGAITRDEAEKRDGLAKTWDSVDENDDGKLNRSEFSAFEEEDLENRAKAYEDAADKAEDRIDSAD